MFQQINPGVGGGSIPAGAHAEAGGRDVPGSKRRIPDATTDFHTNPYMGYNGTHLPGGRRVRRGVHGRGV